MEKNMAELFKAMSDENRLKILKQLLSGERCGCTLINKLPISQPTLSYHLKWLNKVGLTTSYKEGTWNKHEVNKAKINQMIAFLEELRDTEERVCSL